MATDPSWQWRNHRPAIRRDPTLAAVADGASPQYQVLHHEVLVALKTRTGRNLRRNHLVLDADPWGCLTRARADQCAGLAVWASFPGPCPLGLIDGRPLSPFSRASSSRNSAISCFCSEISANNFNTNSRHSGGRPSRSGGVVTATLNQVAPRRGKQILSPRPLFCPSLPKVFSNRSLASGFQVTFHSWMYNPWLITAHLRFSQVDLRMGLISLCLPRSPSAGLACGLAMVSAGESSPR